MPWEFPEGARFLKHFELNDPSGKAIRVETRLLIAGKEGTWAGYTYRWREDGKDADLVEEAGAERVLLVQDPKSPRTPRRQTWKFPSREQCLKCHDQLAGGALGVRTEQLNFLSSLGNQLEKWNQKGRFNQDIGNVSVFTSYVDPLDKTKPLNARARSYLAVNCAMCHQPGALVPTDIDLSFGTQLRYMNIMNALPDTTGPNVPGGRIVKSGNPNLSLLWLRMKRRDKHGMPSIGSTVIDQDGVELISSWIRSGPRG